ncbi:Predicted DNA-binding transcriptional regulator YafY, contains an HTH and WYL domains [Marinospirillum celere]|uniref:Predicted DNA-binding transcriptional regulator YafY, contains an HTH and WYL domains n=1 Tax=Marinospirillum celere TaxID=1122252 RepID=A0A1I1FDL1_9GAMM|nr:WYL domain-containing protein [Marinospirillum celere]SFB97036.1 Predicted DNA-binding transcriptional regulator YafY, contains an HTH and WYL domains [Marinospirillum celere]
MNSAEHRFWQLELIAYWEGKVTPRQLADHWQVSRQHASNQLQDYLQKHPDSLSYHPSSKNYQPTTSFQPQHLSGDVTEYLEWATRQTLPPSKDSPGHLPHETLQHPPRQITPQIMRPLVQAIRENRRLDVDYISLTHPDNQGRILVPHHFVNTGQRWHLRAWCEKSQTFKDFVLSRFRGEPELMDTSAITPDQDKGWNTQLTLILEPDPRLTQLQKQVLEEDYAMHNGQLHIKTRACLANYLLKNLQVHPRILEGEPEAQQLIIVNKDDIKPWLFG